MVVPCGSIEKMIEIKGLSKDLDEFSLRDINLDVNGGEYFVILGPTGAGKTILLETIAGIYHPERGRIFIQRRDITNILPQERNIGMVYQDYMLFPHLTVKENVCFGLRKKEFFGEKIKKIISLFGISHLLSRYPDTLSGGEKQRVAIARALMAEPEVLLLDEPLSALDIQTGERFREELKKIHSTIRTTTIHVTHSFEEAFFLGDRIALMNKGRIVQVGEPEEVFQKPNSEFTAGFLGVENLFQGESTVNNGIAEVDINGIKIVSAAPKSGSRYLSIRPENILVSREKIESSARNSFRGRIENIREMGAIMKITVNIGIPFVVILTRRSFEDLGLAEGSSAYITFKASAVHIF